MGCNNMVTSNDIVNCLLNNIKPLTKYCKSPNVSKLKKQLVRISCPFPNTSFQCDQTDDKCDTPIRKYSIGILSNKCPNPK